MFLQVFVYLPLGDSCYIWQYLKVLFMRLVQVPYCSEVLKPKNKAKTERAKVKRSLFWLIAFWPGWEDAEILNFLTGHDKALLEIANIFNRTSDIFFKKPQTRCDAGQNKRDSSESDEIYFRASVCTWAVVRNFMIAKCNTTVYIRADSLSVNGVTALILCGEVIRVDNKHYCVIISIICFHMIHDSQVRAYFKHFRKVSFWTFFTMTYVKNIKEAKTFLEPGLGLILVNSRKVFSRFSQQCDAFLPCTRWILCLAAVWNLEKIQFFVFNSQDWETCPRIQITLRLLLSSHEAITIW